MSEPVYTGKGTEFYVAAPKVADIVNLAVDLGRPLLVEGEPGCGKTMLAYSVAAEKGLGEPIKIAVKSTTRAQDLLFRLNALRRLQDAQSRENPDARYIYPYLSLGPLGQALHQRKRCVVLIDEVDKADIDFPNDLLDVLDRFSFQIDDLPAEEEVLCFNNKGFGKTIFGEESTRPIVIITSNREKRLPEPFLRRCLYVRLRFPEDPLDLREIVRKNTHLSSRELNDQILNAAIDAFKVVRGNALGNTQKPPSTGELIDWIKILHWKKESEENLKASPGLPPHWEMLFKTMNDLDAYPGLTKSKQQVRED